MKVKVYVLFQKDCCTRHYISSHTSLSKAEAALSEMLIDTGNGGMDPEDFEIQEQILEGAPEIVVEIG